MLQTAQYPEFDPSIADEFGYADAGNTLAIFGVPLYDSQSLVNLLIRFFFNLLICWILVHFCYYKKSNRRDYYVTFMLFSSTMFLLIFLMENVKLQIGFTLGLFAIFGMIRYRTETVPIREMTYLFVIIGVSVINGLAMTVSYAELICTNVLLIALTWILEKQNFIRHRSSKIILYDNINLIVPEKRQDLINDLQKRTGLTVDNIEIGHIDFLRDVAFIKLYYTLKKGESNSIDTITKLKQIS